MNENFKLTALSEGSVKLRICMEENNEIFKEMIINIVETAPETITYQFVGDESIKWGRTKVLQSVKNVNGVAEPTVATFEVIDEHSLLASYEINNSSVTITANDDNKIGTIVVSCRFEDNSVMNKVISVTSLWM
jgi:hypothetical protein